MEEFIKISQQLGKNILLAQGAGGNTSIKIKNRLYIKASGYKLKDMTLNHGYACCLYKPLAAYFNGKKRNTKKDEQQFIQLITGHLIQSETYGLPSMEAGFHAVIPSKYVFHMHSVYVNIFNCMRYGSLIIKKLCKDNPYTILNYANPGYELAYLLSKKQSLPPLIFLKNHGIIIHSQNISECLRLTTWIHDIIEEYLKLNKVFTPFRIASEKMQMTRYLFPDSAVFSTMDINLLPVSKKKELLEINSAQQYIINTIKRLGRTPAYLNKNDVKKLLSMEQEKHRLKIFKE